MAVVSGAAGLEACANELNPCSAITQTACGFHGCGGCGSYAQWMSYPNYLGCNSPGTPLCAANTGLPIIQAYCGSTLTVQHACGPSYAFSVLDECGPAPGQFKFEPLCQRTELLIACLNPATFASVCGCNPCQIGVLGVQIVF